MKIALIHMDPNNHRIDTDHITGGLEKFGQLIYNNIQCDVVQIPWTTKKTTSVEKKKIIQDAQQKIRELNPDVIITSVDKAAGFSSLKNLGYPIASFIHAYNGFMTSNLNQENFNDLGHCTFCVSQYMIDTFYDPKSKRLGQRNITFSGIIKPDFAVKRDLCINDLKYDIVTIGRPSPDKNPFLLNKLMEETNKNILTMSYVPKNGDKEIKYYEKNRHWNSVLLNEPHSSIMDELSKSKTYFSTWNQETFGITALEALSCGVPVILKGDKNGGHASLEIVPNKSLFEVVPSTPSTEDILKAYEKLLKLDRKAIQEETLYHNSKKDWIDNIIKACEYTIENYKKVNKNVPSLTDFV